MNLSTGLAWTLILLSQPLTDNRMKERKKKVLRRKNGPNNVLYLNIILLGGRGCSPLARTPMVTFQYAWPIHTTLAVIFCEIYKNIYYATKASLVIHCEANKLYYQWTKLLIVRVINIFALQKLQYKQQWIDKRNAVIRCGLVGWGACFPLRVSHGMGSKPSGELSRIASTEGVAPWIKPLMCRNHMKKNGPVCNRYVKSLDM